MAKRKSRLSSTNGRGRHIIDNSSFKLENFEHSKNLQNTLRQQRRQTRDYLKQIANEPLSFAEDLRRYSPDRKKFHNIDGSIAETTYKPVVVEKKVRSTNWLYVA